MQEYRRRLAAVLITAIGLGFVIMVVASLVPSTSPPAYAQTVFRRGQQGSEPAEEQKKKEAEETARREEEARKAEEARRRESEARAAREREAAERAERERLERETREAEQRRREAAERERRETEVRESPKVERVEQRPPAAATSSEPSEPPIFTPRTPESSSGRVQERIERSPAPTPFLRSGQKFERVRERPWPEPLRDYIPRYYPYDYEWYRYYHSFPPEREIIFIREEPQIVVIERPMPEPQSVQQPSGPATAGEPDAPDVPAITSPPAVAPDVLGHGLSMPTEVFVFWPGTAERAFEEIGRGWLHGDIRPIAHHVSPETDVRIFQNGTLSHTMKGSEFIELTEDAMHRLETTDFSIQILTRLDAKVFSKGMHKYVGPDGGNRETTVTYTLKKIADDWIIVEAGFAHPGLAIQSQPGG